MSNFKKSFNFRSGVQVDNDNFIVDSLGKVGIGTSSPTEILEVYGTIKSNGLVTTTSLYSNSSQIDFLTNKYGINSSGIVTASVFYGSAAGLTDIYAIAVDGWNISGGTISTVFNVGIGTTIPVYQLQIGENPVVGKNGVALDKSGNVYISGITTIGSSNVLGLSTTRNLLVTGISTIGSSNVLGLSTTRNLLVTGITTSDSSNVLGLSTTRNLLVTGISTIGESNVLGLSTTRNLLVTGISTIGESNVLGLSTTRDLIVTGISSVLGLSTTRDLIVTGISTINELEINSSIKSSAGNSFSITAGIISSTQNTTNNLQVIRNSAATGIATIENSLNVGTSGTGFYATRTGLVGIGTNSPSSTLQIVKNDAANIEVTSKTNEAKIVIGQSVGGGNSTSVFRFGNVSKTLDIINNDTGSVNMYLHSGNSGINTGTFSWIYGQTNRLLLSLTHTGLLGVGIQNPTNNLHVVGTSTVTSDAFFGNDVTVSRDLKVLGGLNVNGNINLPFIVNETNLNNTSGVTTVFDLEVINKLDVTRSGSYIYCNNIGVGTNFPIAGIDARSELLLVDRVGIGTTTQYEELTTNFISDVHSFDNNLYFSTATLVFDSESKIGLTTTEPRSILDFGNVGSSSTIAGYMITPSITTLHRNNLSNYTGIGGTVEGAIIYNSTTKKHQGYGSTNGGATFGWIDLY